jgi:hypothetical protein
MLLVGMWFDGLPVAFLPLWQLTQVPVTASWSNRAFSHDVVVWQSSQMLLVGMWFDDLPVAFLPLWQLTQVPVTASWSNRAFSHDVVV